jgi:hypothetical protein
MADNILPSLPSEHFSDGGKHYLCSVIASYDVSASRWPELDLQCLHLFHRRNRAYRATADDVRQVFAHLKPHQACPHELRSDQTTTALLAQLPGRRIAGRSASSA